MTEQQRYLYYTLPLTPVRLAEVYGCSKDFMRRIVCRAEFTKYEEKYSRHPRKYLWCKEFERKLDKYMEGKGFKRCIVSRAPYKYS